MRAETFVESSLTSDATAHSHPYRDGLRGHSPRRNRTARDCSGGFRCNQRDILTTDWTRSNWHFDPKAKFCCGMDWTRKTSSDAVDKISHSFRTGVWRDCAGSSSRSFSCRRPVHKQIGHGKPNYFAVAPRDLSCRSRKMESSAPPCSSGAGVARHGNQLFPKLRTKAITFSTCLSESPVIAFILTPPWLICFFISSLLLA